MNALIFNWVLYLYSLILVVWSAVTVWTIGLKFKLETVHYFLSENKRLFKLGIKSTLILNSLFCGASILGIAVRLIPHVVPYVNSTYAGFEMFKAFVYALMNQIGFWLLNNSMPKKFSKFLKDTDI